MLPSLIPSSLSVIFLMKINRQSSVVVAAPKKVSVLKGQAKNAPKNINKPKNAVPDEPAEDRCVKYSLNLHLALKLFHQIFRYIIKIY